MTRHERGSKPPKDNPITPQLFDAVTKKEEGAAGRLYHAAYDAVHEFARRIVGHHDAEDVTQDSLHKAIGALEDGKFRKESKPRSWLFTIVRNTALTHKEKSEKQPGSLDAHVELVGEKGFQETGLNAKKEESVEDQVIDRLDVDRLIELVKQLPENQREVFIRRILNEMPHAEIAEELDITENNSKVRLNRAIEGVRRKLDEEDEETPSDQ